MTSSAPTGEGSGHRGVKPDGERQDLDGDIRQLSRVDDVANLLAHHFGAAHDTAQHGLVEHYPHNEQVVIDESFLSGYAQLTEPLSVATAGNNGFDVLLSLKRPGKGSDS